MSDVSQWSNLASNNTSAAPDGFPEGQTAGSLNDSSREVMAAVRRYSSIVTGKRQTSEDS